jgi:hypothetical protein
MLPAHRKLLFLDHMLGAAAVNAAINGGVGYLLWGSISAVPLWGLRGIAADVIATAFLLPFLYCVIATPPLRRAVRHGSLPPLPADALPRALRALPAPARLRGVVLGLLALATLASATIVTLTALGVESLPSSWCIAFKAGWAAVLAAIVGPVIALTAIAESPGDEPADSCGLA